MFQIIFKLLQDFLESFSHTPKTLEELLQEHDVATTALLTNFWKDEARQKHRWDELTVKPGTRQKDLYKDDFLRYFYNPNIAEEAKTRLNHKMWLPLATRTKYFRKTLSQLIKNEGIEQVLILGSGFDTLAVRKSKYPVQYFEIDYAKILACKESIYRSHRIDKNARYIGMDYTAEDFLSALVQQGFDTQAKTFVLWEGNTFYLEKPIVFNILKQLSEALPQLFISFDFMHPQIANEDQTMESFAKRKSPFKSFFSVDEMISECEKLHLSIHTHSTTDVLAQNYGIDEKPYHTAKPYSVITFRH